MVSKEFIQEGKFKKRKYTDYDEYLIHQKDKLGHITDWLKNYDVIYREMLRNRLKETQIDFKGKNVLCLAARIGTEVKSFLDLGAFAIGIDLNPGTNNKLVVHGDFHQLQYSNESVDIVFTNSFDHAFEPEKLISEIERVLKKEGILIMEIGSTPPGSYECLDYEKIEDVINLFLLKGFILSKRRKFSNNNNRFLWRGEQVVLKKK